MPNINDEQYQELVFNKLEKEAQIAVYKNTIQLCDKEKRKYEGLPAPAGTAQEQQTEQSLWPLQSDISALHS